MLVLRSTLDIWVYFFLYIIYILGAQVLVNCLEDYAYPVKVWLGKVTWLVMTPFDSLGCKTATQTH